MSEIWTQIKAQLEIFSNPFPQTAIDLANAHREEVAPYLITCLEAIAADPSPTQNQDYMLHLYAMHLLASWRETRAYGSIVQLGHHPDDVIEDMMGDVVTETYGRILASVCNGDIRPLEALVEDANAGIWARHAALVAMTVRALEGDADREAVITYLADLGEREAQRLGALNGNFDEFELIDGIVSNATDLGAVSMLPVIRQWFAKKLLDESIASERWVTTNIVRSLEECLARLRRNNHSYLSDVATEMAWWAGFKDDVAPAPSKHIPADDDVFDAYSAGRISERPTTIVRDTPKIGRNDPCYCGSGRKYKKCHGSAV
jgi:hypothetical protein